MQQPWNIQLLSCDADNRPAEVTVDVKQFTGKKNDSAASSSAREVQASGQNWPTFV
jgi:hypothetical protein